MVATALPCRISVYPEGGQTVLAAIRPTAMIGLSRTPELGAVAAEVEATPTRLMEEAARG